MRSRSLLLASLIASVAAAAALGGEARGPEPMRPLPGPSRHPMAAGPAVFVDAARGSDAGDGSEARPLKTLERAVARLAPGVTLYLRGGTYYASVAISCTASAEKPATIRAYPGEIAVIDGGIREFFESPRDAWEPCPGGAEGEFRSTRAYPGLEAGKRQAHVLGNFGGSMVPLHGYRFRGDLQSTNEFWTLEEKG